MLRDHLFQRRRQHRRTVIGITCFILFALTSGISVAFGMDSRAVLILAVVFVLAGAILDATIDHS